MGMDTKLKKKKGWYTIMWYKNISNKTVTLYGVKFGPGEFHELSGTVNHKDLYKVAPPQQTKQKETKQETKTETKPIINKLEPEKKEEKETVKSDVVS